MEAEDILTKLASKEREEINEGLKEIGDLWRQHIDEKWGRMEGRKATESLEELLDELIKLSGSPDWLTRYAAMRGIRWAGYTDAGAERILELTRLCFNALKDDDGRVRRMTVHTLEVIRGDFPDDLYVEVFLTLQDMYDLEENPKKRDSIDQALCMLYCPHLESLMLARGYTPVEKVAG